MKITKVVSILLLAVVAVAVMFGAVAYRSASAAAPAAAASTAPVFGHADNGRGPGGGYTNEDLATALGITVEELNAATQKAQEVALDQAVQAGLITQAQADQIKTAGTAYPFGGRWDGWLSQNGIDPQALLADALGISAEELQAAYAKAYAARLDQAVADGNLTQEQADLKKGRYALFNSQDFQSAMQSAFQAAVAKAVSAGLITQAQADQILQENSAAGFMGFGSFEGRPGFGGHGGRGGMAPVAPDAPAP